MTITFDDDNIVASVDDPDATILSVSVANKIPHFRECGGHGRCTTCRVRILDGIQNVTERSRKEARIARQRGWDSSIRLACQTRATGDVRLRRLIHSAADISLLQTEKLHAESGREMPVAILVCDIRRFTPFVDAHLAYDVYHILNRFFGELGEPILVNNGLIYQYVGDQIIALFGIRGESPEKSCQSAVRAGLSMIAALEKLNERIDDEFGVRLDIRIGAHFGPLIVGYMGHPARRDFAVVGDAMNVASRIEGANEQLGTTFLVSQELYDRLAVPMVEGRRAAIPLKGKRANHTLIELLGFAEPDHQQVVQTTARVLLQDPDRFAEVFYRKLFDAAPGLRRMFTGDLKAQGRMLTQTLQLVVYGLGRFRELVPGLVALGRSHVAYGVEPEHYVIFRQVFLETVQELLGAAYDPETQKAWQVALDRIIRAMSKRSGAGRRARPPSSGPLPPSS